MDTNSTEKQNKNSGKNSGKTTKKTAKDIGANGFENAKKTSTLSASITTQRQPARTKMSGGNTDDTGGKTSKTQSTQKSAIAEEKDKTTSAKKHAKASEKSTNPTTKNGSKTSGTGAKQTSNSQKAGNKSAASKQKNTSKSGNKPTENRSSSNQADSKLSANKSKSSSESGRKTDETRKITFTIDTGMPKPSKNKRAEEKDIQVLNQIYQSAQMGKQAISNVLPKVESQTLKKELIGRYQNYDEISGKSASQIIQLGEKPREKNPVSKAVLWGTINVSTLVDDSASNIADVVIKGSHNNINDLTRTLNQNKGISQNVKSLADKMLYKEQSGIDSLKRFL